MTTFAVYHGVRLISRTHDQQLAERIAAACDGRVERIDRQMTAGERFAAERRPAA